MCMHVCVCVRARQRLQVHILKVACVHPLVECFATSVA